MLSEVLNQKMSEMGLTKGQFSRVLGIRQATLSQILTGKRKPSKRVIKILGAHFPELIPYLFTIL